MDEHLKAQVLATYSAYVEAFRANDVAALDKRSIIPSPTSEMVAPRCLTPFRSSPPS